MTFGHASRSSVDRIGASIKAFLGAAATLALPAPPMAAPSISDISSPADSRPELRPAPAAFVGGDTVPRQCSACMGRLLKQALFRSAARAQPIVQTKGV